MIEKRFFNVLILAPITFISKIRRSPTSALTSKYKGWNLIASVQKYPDLYIEGSKEVFCSAGGKVNHPGRWHVIHETTLFIDIGFADVDTCTTVLYVTE